MKFFHAKDLDGPCALSVALKKDKMVNEQSKCDRKVKSVLRKIGLRDAFKMGNTLQGI